MQSNSYWQEIVPEGAGPVPETPQPSGGGTPGGLKGQHVVQRVIVVRPDPEQLFHSNTSVLGTWRCCLGPHGLCRCPCNLVQSLGVCLLGAAEVAFLIVEHGTLDNGLIICLRSKPGFSCQTETFPAFREGTCAGSRSCGMHQYLATSLTCCR